MTNHQTIQNQKQENQNPQQSPNLLKHRSVQTLYPKLPNSKLTPIIFWLTLLLQIFFLVTVGLNYFMNSRLEEASDEIAELEDVVEAEIETFESVRALNRRVEMYKDVTATSNKLYPQVETVFNTLPEDIVLESARFGSSGANAPASTVEMSIKAPNAIRVAYLIAAYSEQESVSRVILESAILDVSDGSYSVIMEIELKV